MGLRTQLDEVIFDGRKRTFDQQEPPMSVGLQAVKLNRHPEPARGGPGRGGASPGAASVSAERRTHPAVTIAVAMVPSSTR